MALTINFDLSEKFGTVFLSGCKKTGLTECPFSPWDQSDPKKEKFWWWRNLKNII